MKTNSIAFIDQLLDRYEVLKQCKDGIIQSIEILVHVFSHGGKLLVCGNGGSAADSEHIVGELMKGFVLPRKIDEKLIHRINDRQLSDALQSCLPAISLVSHSALSTAFSNDQLPSAVFAQQVLGYGQKNDALLCLSTSGNSLNCVYAAKVAKALNLKVISLTGEKKSELEAYSDVTIKVPERETYKIQELHLPIYHVICLVLENEFFGS